MISDDLYQLAVSVVQQHSNASVSHLQRKLHWGFNRTARAIERMELECIVGPMTDSGRRLVLPVQLHELWKENQLLRSQLAKFEKQEDSEILDNEVSQLENALIDRYAMSNDEAEQLEILIAKSMRLGELYALRDTKKLNKD